MPAIPAYRAWCKGCGEEFRVPILSDFTYGEFIAHGLAGLVFGYLNAIDSAAWNAIQAIYGELNLPKSDAARFQHIVGNCLDPIDGQSLSIVSGPRCPRCRSEGIDYRDLPSDRLGSLDVPEASFHQFLALSEPDRRKLIAELACRRL